MTRILCYLGLHHTEARKKPYGWTRRCLWCGAIWREEPDADGIHTAGWRRVS